MTVIKTVTGEITLADGEKIIFEDVKLVELRVIPDFLFSSTLHRKTPSPVSMGVRRVGGNNKRSLSCSGDR